MMTCRSFEILIKYKLAARLLDEVIPLIIFTFHDTGREYTNATILLHGHRSSLTCNTFMISIDQIHKSQNASVPYPTMLHSEQKCAHFCSECSSMALRLP